MSESITRRQFITRGGAAVLGFSVLPAAALARPQGAAQSELLKASLPAALCIYSPEGAEAAGKAMMRGAAALDAVERGMRAVESIPPPKGYNVGLSAVVNEYGQAQVDASIMDGPTHHSGAVGALEGIAHPISVARKVMEKTPHVMVVGKGAQEFARKMGFEVEDIVSDYRKKQYADWLKVEALRKRLSERIAADPQGAVDALHAFMAHPEGKLSGEERGYVLFRGLRNSFGVDYAQPMVKRMKPEEVERIRTARPKQWVGFAGQAEVLWGYERILNGEGTSSGNAPGQSVPDPHETCGLIALTASGDLAVAVSTGGLFGKMNGRVGDSPIIGAGNYVDNDVGGACAVGVGEQMIQTVGCHVVVENMRLGMPPFEACQDALGRMIAKGHDKRVTVAALRKDGAYAAAHLGLSRFPTRLHIFSDGNVREYRSTGVQAIPSETTVEVALLEEAAFDVVIGDITGRPLRTISERRKAGYHTIEWDGRDDAGRRRHPGVYLCTVRTEGHVFPRRRMVLRTPAEDIRRALL